jgi:hypothetical protein
VARFPGKYQPLISAIISINEPDITAPVDFERVRSNISQEVLTKLGWSTFSTFVMVACKEKYVEQLFESGAPLRLRLRFPLPTQVLPEKVKCLCIRIQNIVG